MSLLSPAVIKSFEDADSEQLKKARENLVKGILHESSPWSRAMVEEIDRILARRAGLAISKEMFS